MTHQHTMASPVGTITLEADNDQLISLSISARDALSGDSSSTHPVLAAAAAQLREYFAGERIEFDLPMSPRGTSFQKAIWAELEKIPYGAVTSYGELGQRAGVGKAARAVGGAVGANPLPIVIPCHRVLSATHAITGYSGGAGIPTKKTLLDLEGISYR
jgi:methylated-DNA-[protein]-cysteine S-methyltransferase